MLFNRGFGRHLRILFIFNSLFAIDEIRSRRSLFIKMAVGIMIVKNVMKLLGSLCWINRILIKSLNKYKYYYNINII